jgi:uncharacterized protein (TIGR02145 family)
MKRNLWFFLLMPLVLIGLSVCTKEEPPPIEEVIIPDIAHPDLTYGSVSDIDSNVYKTVKIGTQIWIAENLKTTKYNNGDQIPLGYGAPAGYTDWFDGGDSNYRWYGGAYCWYDNNASKYKDAYGALYNWHAVNTGKLCPTGWHVPTDLEWTTLTDILSKEGAAVGPLTNPNGFAAIPTCELDGWGFGQGAIVYWSSTPESGWNAYLRSLNEHAFIRAWEPKSYGYSVRCLKD